ncbi:MAG TPA: hypothetical protein VK004_03270 [Ignavibacteria bacterium]|nr:hypothetical protein [Ignavibacteria bacterium]
MEKKGKKNIFYRGAKYAGVMAMLMIGFIAFVAATVNVTGAKGNISSMTLYSTDGRTVTAGPVVGTADVSGNNITVKITGLPAGSYERVKVTLSGRNSGDSELKSNAFIVTGTAGGKDIDYKSSKTVTRDLSFKNPITVGSDGVLTLSGNVDMKDAFMNGNVELDPENASNLKAIGRNLGPMLKAAFGIM